MVQYGDKVVSPDMLMFVELMVPVPYDKAVISVDDVLNRRNTGSKHSGGMNTAHYNTAVKFLSETVDIEELKRMVGD